MQFSNQTLKTQNTKKIKNNDTYSMMNKNFSLMRTDIKNSLQICQELANKYQEFYQNKMPQVCLKHNNIQTLYCQKQREPLCVNCMYYGNEHKNHKITPLKNATRQILTDTQNLQNKMNRKIEWIQGLINVSHSNLENIQKLYPQIRSQISSNFRKLKAIIQQKQNQQIQRLNKITQTLRSQHITIIEQFNKLLCFFVLRNNFKSTSYDDSLLCQRNILSQIVKQAKYPIIKIINIESLTFLNSFNPHIYKEIEGYIKQKSFEKEFPQIINFQYNQPEVQTQDRFTIDVKSNISFNLSTIAESIAKDISSDRKKLKNSMIIKDIKNDISQMKKFQQQRKRISTSPITNTSNKLSSTVYTDLDKHLINTSRNMIKSKVLYN